MCFYAGDKDIDVEMEMYGGKGVTQSGVGGEVDIRGLDVREKG